MYSTLNAPAASLASPVSAKRMQERLVKRGCACWHTLIMRSALIAVKYARSACSEDARIVYLLNVTDLWICRPCRPQPLLLGRAGAGASCRPGPCVFVQIRSCTRVQPARAHFGNVSWTVKHSHSSAGTSCCEDSDPRMQSRRSGRILTSPQSLILREAHETWQSKHRQPRRLGRRICA